MATLAMSDGGGRLLWTDQATLSVLNLIKDLDVVHVLQSKRQRNQQTFITIQEHLSPLGYDWSWQQIRCHWKNLKARYNHERRNLRPGQKSTWKYYNVMEALLKQRTGGQDSSNARGDDSENSSGAENSADIGYHTPCHQASNGLNEHSNNKYIVPTLDSPPNADGTFIQQSSSMENDTEGAAAVQIKREVASDEETQCNEPQCNEPHVPTTSASCEDLGIQPSTPVLQVLPLVNHGLSLSPEHLELQQIERILAEPDEASMSAQHVEAPLGSANTDVGCSTDSRARTTKRFFFSSNAPGIVERKARLELDVLVATKRKLLAEQMKAEAEQRKATAETMLLTEALKKCDEEKKKVMAETMFLVQERVRSEEETRRAAAIAAFHIEEKRKAAAEAEMFLEHKRYLVEQKKTEVVKRRMLLLELQKMRREHKMGP
ncbi:uncharacterized protein LOC144098464 [Amblyomma americanum]|uniref:Myb/SANT-like DNA-binding domain-containing protein n=1 Tax=Amblyomma americanum TaxID=6943 RepID=A0AAQ4EMR4_AMBAM